VIRRTLILISFLLFPITIFYFSPYIILLGAAHGIVNASLLVFAVMFLSAIVLGRLWCGWACPGAGLQEAATIVNDRSAYNPRLGWIKWALWVPWVASIAVIAIPAGGYRVVDPLFHIGSVVPGISVDHPLGYVIYYAMTGLIFVLSLAVGRRAFCHYVCWMAPFMILGRKLGDALRLPGLRLKVAPGACISCHRCDRACPMALPVQQMVDRGAIDNSACILCGTCVDTCPKHAIAFTIGRPQQAIGRDSTMAPPEPAH
jgi:polyferredoxin